MKYIIASIFSIGMNLISAQVEQGEWIHRGQIVTKDSTIIKGYLMVIANETHPWGYQSKIRFMEEEKWNNLAETPENSEFDKYSPSELLEYSLTDLQLRFMSKSFSDMSSLSMSMIPKKYFMKVIEDGKIKLFHYYDAPSEYYTASEEEIKENESVNNYALIQIGNEKLKNANDISIQQIISDCPKVLEDYNAGKYGASPNDTSNKKGSTKLKNKVMDSNALKNYLAPIIRDYNRCRGK